MSLILFDRWCCHLAKVHQIIVGFFEPRSGSGLTPENGSDVMKRVSHSFKAIKMSAKVKGAAEVHIADVDIDRYHAVFQRLDTNKDGHVQLEELEAEMRSKNIAEEHIAAHAQVS